MSHPVLYNIFPPAAPANWSIPLSKCEITRSYCYV